MDKPVKANLFMLCFMVYNGLLPIAIAVLIKLIPGVDYDMFEKYITLFQIMQDRNSGLFRYIYLKQKAGDLRSSMPHLPDL